MPKARIVTDLIEMSFEELVVQFLEFGGAYDELCSATDAEDQPAQVYWMKQLQCYVEAMAERLAIETGGI